MASDSFAMLAGYSAMMPSSFQSSIKETHAHKSNRVEGRGEEDEREGRSRRAPLKPIYAFYYSS